MIDETRLYRLVGERLRKLREDFEMPEGRMTQAGLAALVNLERTSITNIEKGVQKVSLHALYGICDALQATVADVLPPASEVEREKALPERTALEYGGRTYTAPPKALQRISAILDLDDDDTQP